MDESDPDITFDDEGICIHCRRFDDAEKYWENKKDDLSSLIASIQQRGIGRKHDCVVGVSGGVDSSYLLFLVQKLGLRPLAVHCDNHWDSPVSRTNISAILHFLSIPVKSYELDWAEVRDVQRAFLMSSTPDLDIASDHAIHAMLWKAAKEAKVNYVFSGMNYRTETHGVRAWSQGHRDWKYIKSIHDRYGSVPLKTFPHFQPWTFLYKTLRKKPHIVPLLNYVDYVKADAVKYLIENCGFMSYGGKHGENLYTKFIQGYILPVKFRFDKRKPHLSSLICAGEVTRVEALKELRSPSYDVDAFASDKKRFMAKLGFTPKQFHKMMLMPPKSYHDFPNSVFFNDRKLRFWRKLWRRRFR